MELASVGYVRFIYLYTYMLAYIFVRVENKTVDGNLLVLK